jgi:hypothetical protein
VEELRSEHESVPVLVPPAVISSSPVSSVAVVVLDVAEVATAVCEDGSTLDIFQTINDLVTAIRQILLWILAIFSGNNFVKEKRS